MEVAKAVDLFMEYHRNNSKKNTVRNYTFILTRFDEEFGDKNVEEITSVTGVLILAFSWQSENAPSL